MVRSPYDIWKLDTGGSICAFLDRFFCNSSKKWTIASGNWIATWLRSYNDHLNTGHKVIISNDASFSGIWYSCTNCPASYQLIHFPLVLEDVDMLPKLGIFFKIFQEMLILFVSLARGLHPFPFLVQAFHVAEAPTAAAISHRFLRVNFLDLLNWNY